MFDFYNSLFQVLFSFGYNYPQQIVAKAAGKVKVFRCRTEELKKTKRGLGILPYGNSPTLTVGKCGEFRLCHDTGSGHTWRVFQYKKLVVILQFAKFFAKINEAFNHLENVKRYYI